MKLPGPRELVAPILKLAQERGRLSQADIYNFIAFEFGAYEGGPANKQPTDLWRFSAQIQFAQKQLLRDGLLQKEEAGSFAITPRGEAFLAKGLTKLDARVREALANLPAVASVPPPPPAPATVPTSEAPKDDITTLLYEAKLKYYVGGEGLYVIPFDGDLRTWLFDVWQCGGWLCLRTHVLRLPDAPTVRNALIEGALKANASISGAKFSVTPSGSLGLDCEYRIEHVDVEVLNNLIAMLMRLVTQRYPELVRIATGQQALESLEMAYKRSNVDNA